MRDNDTERRAHPHHALTARSVQHGVSKNGRPRRIADGGGLYLLIAAGGSKSWLLRTVVKGKRCDLGLGSVSLVSLSEAREEAQKLRKVARAGGDPLAERQRDRRVTPTFDTAAKAVHLAHSPSFRNDKHKKQWLSSLTGVLAAFGSKRVDAVTSADVLSALSGDWLAKPETSRRVLQRVRVIFDWCKAQGFRLDNPTDGLTKALPKHRATREHHPALPYQQVPAFIQTVRDSDAAETGRLAFELTILCATRTSETLNATWDEIDLAAKVWTIPAGRMKAGTIHRVPLSDRAVEILNTAKARNERSRFVFPGRREERPLSNMVFLMALRRMNRQDLTVHGFRSSFRDWAAERTNAPRAVCEAALAHTVKDKTEAAYNRTDLFDRRRELMASWAAFVTAKPSVVIPMRA